MPSPMPFHKFNRLVRSRGYSIAASSRHHEVIDAAGNKLMNFAVRHKSGGKREVLPAYVSQFLVLTREPADQTMSVENELPEGNK